MGTFLSAFRNALVVIVVGFVALVVVEPGTAEAFCAPTVVDYAAPLEGLPPLLPLEAKGGRQAAGRHFSVRAASVPQVVSAGPEVSFTLDFGRARPPAWKVSASLAQQAPDGRFQTPFAQRKRGTSGFRPGHPVTFKLTAPGVVLSPGVYRRMLQIVVPGRRRPLRIGSYFRVLQPQRDVRLSIDNDQLAPGQSASVCLENFGTEFLLFSDPYSIFRETPSGWAPANIGPTYFTLPLYGIGPGEADRPWTFQIPAGTEAGRYRFVSEVLAAPSAGSKPPVDGSPFAASVDFSVR